MLSASGGQAQPDEEIEIFEELSKFQENNIGRNEAALLTLRNELNELTRYNRLKADELSRLNADAEALEAEALEPPEFHEDQRHAEELEEQLDLVYSQIQEANRKLRIWQHISDRDSEIISKLKTTEFATEEKVKALTFDFAEVKRAFSEAKRREKIAQAEEEEAQTELHTSRKSWKKKLLDVKRAIKLYKSQLAEQRRRNAIRQSSSKKVSKDAEERTLALKEHLKNTQLEKKSLEDQQQLEKLLDAFKRIKDSTGLDNPEDVADKFIHREAKESKLIKELKDMRGQVAELHSANDELYKEWEVLQLDTAADSGNRRLYTQLDHFSSVLNDKTNAFLAAKRQTDRLDIALNEFTACLQRLVGRLQDAVNCISERRADALLFEVLHKGSASLKHLVSNQDGQSEMDAPPRLSLPAQRLLSRTASAAATKSSISAGRMAHLRRMERAIRTNVPLKTSQLADAVWMCAILLTRALKVVVGETESESSSTLERLLAKAREKALEPQQQEPSARANVRVRARGCTPELQEAPPSFASPVTSGGAKKSEARATPGKRAGKSSSRLEKISRSNRNLLESPSPKAPQSGKRNRQRSFRTGLHPLVDAEDFDPEKLLMSTDFPSENTSSSLRVSGETEIRLQMKKMSQQIVRQLSSKPKMKVAETEEK